MFNTDFALKFFKCRTVKSPEKHGNAAGWDFFVPTGLTVNDFIKKPEMFLYMQKYMDNNVVQIDTGLTFILASNTSAKLFLYKKLDGYKYELITDNNMYLNEDSFSEQIIRILIDPGAKVCIPSGIHVNLPKHVFLNAENKSGIASKRGLVKGACVVGQTNIITNNGLIPANVLTSEYCKENDILIKTMLSDGTFEYKKCCGFTPTNREICMTVKFKNGSKISANASHCIYLDKWYSLQTLITNFKNKEFNLDITNTIIQDIIPYEKHAVDIYSTNIEDSDNYVSQSNIINKNCLIDQDYQGQIHINLINTSATEKTYIQAGQKIVQFVPFFQPTMTIAQEYTSKEELYAGTSSVRGEGGFGSSGLK